MFSKDYDYCASDQHKCGSSKYIQLKYFDQVAKLETSNFPVVVLSVKSGIYKLCFVKKI